MKSRCFMFYLFPLFLFMNGMIVVIILRVQSFHQFVCVLSESIAICSDIKFDDGNLFTDILLYVGT